MGAHSPRLRASEAVAEEARRQARALISALRALEFVAAYQHAGHGGERIEVRHPQKLPGGSRRLVALVSLKKTGPELAWCEREYQGAVVRALSKAVTS